MSVLIYLLSLSLSLSLSLLLLLTSFLFTLILPLRLPSLLPCRLLHLWRGNQFGALCPIEPRLGKKLSDPLTSLIHSTSAMSLLYECICTVITGLANNTAVVQVSCLLPEGEVV